MRVPVVINGPPRAGKDTFVQMCHSPAAKLGLQVINISSVDLVKQAAVLLGWDQQKDAKGRAFLSALKDMSTAQYDGPLRYMLRCLEHADNALVFFHIREPEEIRKFVEVTGATTLLVRRPAVEEDDHSNHADSRVMDCFYDRVIWNMGSLTDLQIAATQYVMNLDLSQEAP